MLDVRKLAIIAMVIGGTLVGVGLIIWNLQTPGEISCLYSSTYIGTARIGIMMPYQCAEGRFPAHLLNYAGVAVFGIGMALLLAIKSQD